ncbi:MAG: hypothetical protein ACM3US_00130 [Sphingomonadaceae bacterium]
MRRLAVGLVLAVAVAAAGGDITLAQTVPEFRMGFAALASLISEVVGQPISDEQFNPQTGESSQLTTEGLMVWRKADNVTAFTDGHTTTLQGPFGLQQRPNDTLFAWERPAALVELPTTAHFTPDISIGVAIQQLSTTPAGQELLTSATESGVLIAREFLPRGVLGAFIGEQNLAILSAQLDPTPSQVRAAVLAHELQHASDAASQGTPQTAAQCFDFEFRAFSRQAQVWNQLWQGNLPPDENVYFTELNDITRTVQSNPEAFVTDLVRRYRSECGLLPS